LLVVDIVARVAHQMDHTQLNPCVSKDRLNRLWQSREAIYTGNKAITRVPIAQLGADRKPKCALLRFLKSTSPAVLSALPA
jgi:hypothetical protein